MKPSGIDAEPRTGDPDRRPLSFGLGVVRAWLWRFGTLPFARRLFARLPTSLVLRRRFAGGELALEVSRSDTHKLLFLEGERFVSERELLRRLVFSGATVVDVGSNIGYIALLFAETVGPKGRVVCLEPIPDNLIELRRNVELNELSQVEILPIAAGDSSGTTTMTQGLNGVMAGSTGDLEVEIRRLDDLDLEKVDLVKIDVEGFERSVLAGASELLREQHPTLFVEIHPSLAPHPGDPEAILDMLRSYGYFSFEAFRPTLSQSLGRKLCSRYLGKLALDETNEPLSWIRDAGRGGSSDPFWLVASAGAERGGEPLPLLSRARLEPNDERSS